MPHGRICASMSASSRLLVYIFFFSGRSRSPARNRSFSFSRSPLCRANAFSFQYLSSIPRVSLSASPLLPYFLALTVPFLLFFIYFCLVPAKRLYRQYIFLVSSLLPYFLDYVVPSYSSSSFCYFLSYSPISYGWQPLFWHIILT